MPSFCENRWPEWWQFFLGMAIAAVASIVFSNTLDRDGEAGHVDQSVMKIGRILVMLQLAGCVLGMLSLVWEGKFPIDAAQPRWAANNILFFGALAIAAISLNALRSVKSE